MRLVKSFPTVVSYPSQPFRFIGNLFLCSTTMKSQSSVSSTVLVHLVHLHAQCCTQYVCTNCRYVVYMMFWGQNYIIF